MTFHIETRQGRSVTWAVVVITMVIVTLTTAVVILTLTIGIKTQDVTMDTDNDPDLGFVMYHGLVTSVSQRRMDTSLETLDEEWIDDNIDEMKDDLLAEDRDENEDDANDHDDDDDSISGSSRVKRFLLNKPNKLWPKCVIPYTLDMTTLTFTPSPGTWSSDQPESKACVHEIGHALGFSHEQQNPYRDDYIRINYENIKPDNIYAFYKQDFHRRRKVFPWKYDHTSVMHYGMKAFNKNGLPVITLLDPRMKYLIGDSESQFFYFLREAEEVYRCTDDKCPNYNVTCAYEGYLTYRNGRCECRCIAGLDPATNCTTIEDVANAEKNNEWPTGGYSMLKVKDVECPGGSKKGSITHYGQGDRSRDYSVAGSVTSQATKLEFCTFKSTISGTLETWPPGEYCISRAGGLCPKGFTNGFLQYADSRSPVTAGVIPDGNFTRHTKLEFCCRKDGDKYNPIELPISQPFILWKQHAKGCQKVQGAVSFSQYFEFTNQRRTRIPQINRPVPLYRRRQNIMRLSVCLYRPVKTYCGGIIHLTEADAIQEIMSPNFPDPYRPLSVCTWVIQSPPSTTMQLRFSEFEIPTSSDDSTVCQDAVEIRSFLPGQPGIPYCGSGFRHSVESQTNIMTVILRSKNLADGSRRFRASISLAPKEDQLCYLPSDKGWTYRGNVNFTHDLRSCLPWRDVTNCRHHEFQESDRFAGLDSNKCRSPGLGTRPWCYTQAEDCRRDYCDVCGVGNCFDILDDCTASLAADSTYCDLNLHIKAGQIGCARTCGLCDLQESSPEQYYVIYRLSNPADVWLGLNDRQDEGSLVWTDGTPLDHDSSGLYWHKGKVSNTARRNCAKMTRSGTLMMTKCNSREEFVCQIPFSTSMECSDDRPDCTALIGDRPEMCMKFRGFAVRSCAASCGFCTIQSDIL
ncbi:uncharacterized protein [Argopecten irradians]|uniref:uncharacterized protein n=1 Tax=Argopecten irradians TaxID=31199 RepID=UPI00371E0A32